MKNNAWKAAAIAAAVSTVILSSPVQAAAEVWDMDWTPVNGFGGLSRTWGLSDVGSSFATWNVFQNEADPGAGIIVDTNPDASFGKLSASVMEVSGGAFIPGSGNIYSFSVPTSFLTQIVGSDFTSGARDIALRIETQGTALSEPSVLFGGAAPTSRNYKLVGSLGGFGGSEEEWVFVWKSVTDASLSFTFDASGSSMSLSQIGMYVSPVAAVPEPHEWMLMVAGLGLVGFTARKRRDARRSTR